MKEATSGDKGYKSRFRSMSEWLATSNAIAKSTRRIPGKKHCDEYVT